MTAFQLLTIVPLGLLALWELLAILRRAEGRPMRCLRLLAWVTAAIAIANPGIVQRMAVATGIDRGASLVLYLFVIATMISAFYFYARQHDLQRQITELVRHSAIKEAKRGQANSSAQASPTPSDADRPGETP
jgi:hypothetical protein